MCLLINPNKPITEQHDSMIWTIDATSSYTVKSFSSTTNSCVYDRRLEENVVQFIWQKMSPTHAELLAWFLIQEKLKCGSYLSNLVLIS